MFVRKVFNFQDDPFGRIIIDLDGPRGNAFALIGLALELSGYLGKDGERVTSEMIATDYGNLIDVFNQHFSEFVTLMKVPIKKAQASGNCKGQKNREQVISTKTRYPGLILPYWSLGSKNKKRRSL